MTLLGLALLAITAMTPELPGPGAAAPEAAVTEAELTVTAQRLRSIEFRVGRSNAGKPRCKVTRSSGDRRIDAMICDDSLECVKDPAVTGESLDACLRERRPALIERVAALPRKQRKQDA